MTILFEPLLKEYRRQNITRKQVRRAVLGDRNGVVYDPQDPSRVRVRYYSSTDVNGNATYTPYTLVKAGTVNYLDRPNRGVLVGYDTEGELAILGADTQEYRAAGINPAILNLAASQNRFIYLRNVVRLMSRPVGTTNTSSTLINVQPTVFYYDNEVAAYRGTETQASKPDLASHIPGENLQNIAVVWLSLMDNDEYVTSSTPKALGEDINDDDFAECVSDRPFEAVPIQTYRLQNAQGAVTSSALYRDLRQFINMPDVHGFPSPVSYRERIRAGRKSMTYGTLQVTKHLVVEGHLAVL